MAPFRWNVTGLSWFGCFLLGACGDGISDATTFHRGVLEIDLRPLAQTGPVSEAQIATILDSVALDVTPAGQPTISFGRKVAARDSVVALSLSVPEGRNTFEGRVLSTNGSLLFSGSAIQDVRQDDFTVDLFLRPQSPFLVVGPDSLTIRSGQVDSSLVVQNRGTGILVWDQDAVTPVNTSCTPSPCLVIRPTTGRLEAGERARVTIQPNYITPQTFLLGFRSPEGSVLVRVVVVR